MKSFARTSTMRQQIQLLVQKAATFILLCLVMAWTFFPILWIVATSLKPETESMTRPPTFVFEPSLDAYKYVLSWGTFRGAFLNTVFISIATTVLVVSASTPAGYAFSRFRFAGRRTLYFSLLALRIIPPVAAIVPLFLLFQRAKLMDTHVGLILLYSSFLVSFATIMMKAFFDEIPPDLEECAMVDGCTRFQAFLRICLPLVAPGISGTAVYALVSAWNEFLFALIFTSRAAKTAPVFLGYFVGETGIEWSHMAAGATLVMIPSLLLAWIVQRNLVRGLAVGAVKG